MLKQNDIVLFKNEAGDSVLGIIRGKPGTNPAPNEYTIFTLTKDKTKYKIVGKSEETPRGCIYLKFTSVKKTKVTAKNFKTTCRVVFNDLSDENMEALINWPNLSDVEQAELLATKIEEVEEEAAPVEEEQ